MNEDLAQLDPYARLLFAGLWTIADRDGRLLDKPMRIKAQLLPYNDVDVEAMLKALHDAHFIERYEAGDIKAIQVVNFELHQRVHPKENPSSIPSREQVRQCHSYSGTSPGKNSKGDAQAIEVDPVDPEGKVDPDPEKIPKEKSGKVEAFKLPDGSGHPRVPHPNYPMLWLSGPELGRLHIKFTERGLRPEFWDDAFETVEGWFKNSTTGRKEYPRSVEHADRVGGFGLKEALRSQRDADTTKAAADRAAGKSRYKSASDITQETLRAALMAPEDV